MFNSLFQHNGLSLDRLHTLLLLKEKGSLIRAADGDPIRQSMMSRHIKDLSSCFGADLTERNGKTLQLTAAGKELALIAEEQFRRLAAFQERASGVPHTVAIGANISLLTSAMAPRMGQLIRLAKGCRFELRALSEDAIHEGLHENRLSLGLLPKRGVPNTLENKPLMTRRYSLFVPERLASTRGITFRDALLESPFALNEADHRLARDIREIARTLGEPHFTPTLACASEEQCATAVRSGHFAAILPSSMSEEKAGAPVQVIEDQVLDSLGGEVSIVWNRRHLDIHPHVTKIRDRIVDLCASLC